jgi:predicted kinase
VVLDFAANTVNDRAWIRSLFEAGNAAHELHVIEVSEEVCKARLRVRNETKPEGLYFGHVPEEFFGPVTSLIVPPADAEGFNVIRHVA